MYINSSASQTVEIKVKMDCDGCERRVKNAVSHMKGYSLSLSHSHMLGFRPRKYIQTCIQFLHAFIF